MVPLTSTSSLAEPATYQPTPMCSRRTPLPSYSICNFTSNSVITLPFRWLTSTSPSMLNIFETVAETSPCSADVPMRDFSRYCRAHSLTSLLTQCQLFGLWRTMLGKLCCTSVETWAMPSVTHPSHVFEAEQGKGRKYQIKGALSSDKANQQKKSTSLL